MNYFEDTWSIIDTYFRTNKYFITKHHLDSWNDFVSSKIISTIKVLNPFIIIKNQDNGKIVHEINIFVGGINGDEVFLNKPTIYENGKQRIMYPNEARIRDLTYQSDLYANILVKYITKEINETEETTQIEEIMMKNVKIGAFPIMLHSKLCALSNQPFDVLREMGECPYDQGGYFIIDGKEKVIVAQERIALNKLFINPSKDDRFSYEALVRSTSEENPLFPKTIRIYVTKDSSTYGLKNLKIAKKAIEKPVEQVESTDKKEDKEKGRKERIPNSIVLTCPNIKKDVPLFIIFRALGIESDKDIIEHIVYDVNDAKNEALIDFLRYSVLDSNSVISQEDAFKYLQGYVEYNSVEKVKHVLLNDLFPNVGTSFKNKAMFLGHLINRLVKTVLKIIPESDRDNYVYKRVDISGFLIGNLFRDYYNQFRNTVRSSIDRQYLYGPWRTTKEIKSLINKSNINYIFKSKVIEDGFKKSLKGSWGKSMIEEVQDSDNIKQGIVQDVSRISYMGFISHLRRVNTPMDPTSKIVAPHRLHPSQWGIMCPIESPDGASIGLLKHFAVLCNVTFEIGIKSIAQCFKDCKLVSLVEDIDDVHDVVGSCKVLINSNWYGITEEPLKLYQVLKLLKRNGFLNKYVSISWDIINMELNVSTEAGRCMRPVYVVENGKLLIEKYLERVKNKKYTWFELVEGESNNNKLEYSNPFTHYKVIDENVDELITLLKQTQAPIEYLDVEESNCSLIAMDATKISKTTTHCEIHPSAILSVVSQNIPLLNHNQAPRNIFFGAQGKQAVGMPMTSFNHRIDTMSYVLHYPQKQLVTTRYKEYLYNNVLTGGENLIVAISTWTGYNQEDSIIINKASIERGMFNMTYFKNIIEKQDENKNDNEKIVFMNPLKAIDDGIELNNMKFAKYRKTLDENGYPNLNVYITESDAIIGKALIKTEFTEDNAPTNIFGNKVKKEIYTDKSVIADKTLSGIVDKVFVYNDVENKKTCKIRLRKVKRPELGDKMASVHGQKGVVGMILSPENMPYNRDGIVPDIIVNPHAFPSRMTIGHLLECILAKTCVYKGMMLDATPFNNNSYESIYSELESKFGLEKYGNEIMYNGRTGEQIHTEIFFGPTYYQRLKHMVSDKINYRTTGPMTVTTRQPTKGRGNNGGLRIGEMERDSVLSHGMSAFLKESLMERSDKYMFDIENSNGEIAVTNKKTMYFKPFDDNDSFYSTVKAPYSLKLLLQEIKAMGVKPILSTSRIEEEEFYEDAEVEDMELSESEL